MPLDSRTARAPPTAASRAWGSSAPSSSAPFGSSSTRFSSGKESGKPRPAPPTDLLLESKAVQVGYKEQNPPNTTPRHLVSGSRAAAAHWRSTAAPMVVECKENRGSSRSCNRPAVCHTVELTLDENAPDPACRGGSDCVVPKRAGSASHPRTSRGSTAGRGSGAAARVSGSGGGGGGSGVMARPSGSGGAARARRSPSPRHVSAPAAERTRPDTGGWQNAASRLASRSLAEPGAVCSADLLSAAQLGLCDVRGGDTVRGGLLGGDRRGGGGGGGGGGSTSSVGRTNWLLGLEHGRATTDQTAAMMVLRDGDAAAEGGGDGLRASVGSLGLGSESDDESSGTLTLTLTPTLTLNLTLSLALALALTPTRCRARLLRLARAPCVAARATAAADDDDEDDPTRRHRRRRRRRRR